MTDPATPVTPAQAGTQDDRPDFEALRAKRNAAAAGMIAAAAIEMGGDPSTATSTFDPNACYCACPSGPCEHDFQGWREFEDGYGGGGGEAVCTRCGMGAMNHGLRTAP